MHVAGEVPEEGGHAVSLNITEVGGIEVIESLLEVLSKIVLSGLSLESHVGVEDLISSLFSLRRLENELASGLSLRGGKLKGVVVDHGPHEHIVAGLGTTESLRDLSVIGAVSLNSFKIVMISLEARMRVIFIPDGGRCSIDSNSTDEGE